MRSARYPLVHGGEQARNPHDDNEQANPGSYLSDVPVAASPTGALSVGVLGFTARILLKLSVDDWETRRPLGHAEEWRILAKEAAEEQDPEKLMEIIDALNRALDEQDAQKKESNSPVRKRAA